MKSIRTKASVTGPILTKIRWGTADPSRWVGVPKLSIRAIATHSHNTVTWTVLVDNAKIQSGEVAAELTTRLIYKDKDFKSLAVCRPSSRRGSLPPVILFDLIGFLNSIIFLFFSLWLTFFSLNLDWDITWVTEPWSRSGPSRSCSMPLLWPLATLTTGWALRKGTRICSRMRTSLCQVQYSLA